MDEKRFDEMVARLERESRAAPAFYKVKVALLALLGVGVLLLVLSFASLGILLLAGVAALAVFSGAKAVLLLVKLGKFLILLAAPLWMLLKSSVSALLTRFPVPVGREIARPDAPRLFAALDEMCDRMKGPPFHHVLITDDMNAAVVQRPLLGLFGFPRNYLLLGLPLLESLSPGEALAVVAHEYGHLSGAHARFGAFIYRLRHTWSAIQGIASQWEGIGGRLLRRVIGSYAPFFNAYTFVLARANEYEADAASAELVSPATAASALKRVNVAGAQYQKFLEEVFVGVRDSPAPPPDVAERWSQNAVVMPPEAFATRWLAESLNRARSAFDTHPVLRARLEALPGQAACVESLPAPLAEPSAATAWLGSEAGRLRAALQAEWRERVGERWRHRHEELLSQRKRLAELRALGAPSIDETVERLRLQVALEPDRDHLPEIVAFNAAVPDRATTLFLEGDLRLRKDDDSGVGLLARAMDLDADAIKPLCERAYSYLVRRGQTERAQPFQERWRERHAWERRREAEFKTLDPTHAIVAADLDPEVVATVRKHLDGHSKGIARAWLGRRVLPTDARVLTYVIVLELTRWARLRSRGPAIVRVLAAIEWPVHLFICTVEANKTIAEKLRKVPRSAVFRAADRGATGAG